VPPRARFPDREALLGQIPPAVALVGAGLAVWSPYLSIYNITSPSEDGIDFISTTPGGNVTHTYNHLHMDGWGRFFLSGTGIGTNQGTRLGVVLIVGAGILVLGAVLMSYAAFASRSGKAKQLLTGGRVLVIAGASVCAAMAAACYAEFLPIRNQLQGDRSLDPAQVATQIRVSVGPAWVVAAIAALTALLAIGGSLLIERQSRR
jgi:hypothetical protein